MVHAPVATSPLVLTNRLELLGADLPGLRVFPLKTSSPTVPCNLRSIIGPPDSSRFPRICIQCSLRSSACAHHSYMDPCLSGAMAECSQLYMLSTGPAFPDPGFHVHLFTIHHESPAPMFHVAMLGCNPGHNTAWRRFGNSSTPHGNMLAIHRRFERESKSP